MKAPINVGDPYVRVCGKIEGDGNPTGKPTVSTNLDPWEIPESEQSTKERTQAGLRRLTHMYQSTALCGLSGRRCA